AGHGFELVFALPVAFPAHARGRVGAGAAALHRNLVGHHEGRIEAHAELPDQTRVGLLLAAHGFQEATRAGAGDGADVGHDVIAAHADAIVADGDGARLGVVADVDAEIGG